MTPREIAQAATNGPWEVTTCMDYWVQSGNVGVALCGDHDWIGQSNVIDTQSQMEANARFIAHFNPATVLAMLDEIARLREVLEPFVRLADEIEECALQMVPGTPEADPNNWFKGCPWEDLARARRALKGE